MLAVGVPQDAAAAAAAAAAATSGAALADRAVSSEPNKPSFWRRLLVIGTGMAGAWSAWNLYGESVVKWGSGMMQWLEIGGEAAADEQQQHLADQLSSAVASPVASDIPPHPSSSRMVLRGNAWVDEGCDQQQQQPRVEPSHQASSTEHNERLLQAEALKVTHRTLRLFTCSALSPRNHTQSLVEAAAELRRSVNNPHTPSTLSTPFTTPLSMLFHYAHTTPCNLLSPSACFLPLPSTSKGRRPSFCSIRSHPSPLLHRFGISSLIGRVPPITFTFAHKLCRKPVEKRKHNGCRGGHRG